VIGRWGEAVLAAIARGGEISEPARPVLERSPRLRIPGVAARRIEALRQWRSEAAPRFGLEPGLLLPNRLITTVALAAPRDTGALATLDGVRRWRAETFGGEIIAALAAP
jgi:ribonuclease D